MAQWINESATKPEDLNLIPGADMVEGETPKFSLTST